MKVLALSGSLRRDSYSRGLLRAARALAPAGVEIEPYDGWAEVPAFNQDLEGDPPASVDALRDRIAAADALLFATPEYNGSVPGALKNAVDWASRPRGRAALAGMPAAVIGSSPSPFGATWAQEHLRRALMLSGAVLVDGEVAIGKVNERFTDGELADGEARAQIGEVLSELVELAATETALAA
jgi:chromate reductase, NAD(P)H dehydrogenase (quinone)